MGSQKVHPGFLQGREPSEKDGPTSFPENDFTEEKRKMAHKEPFFGSVSG